MKLSVLSDRTKVKTNLPYLEDKVYRVPLFLFTVEKGAEIAILEVPYTDGLTEKDLQESVHKAFVQSVCEKRSCVDITPTTKNILKIHRPLA